MQWTILINGYQDQKRLLLQSEIDHKCVYERNEHKINMLATTYNIKMKLV